jgi:hypothetical protein
VLWLQADAPAKPEPSQPCNGCGVCCSAAPCPLGSLLSLSTQGPCAQLQWRVDLGRYVCGVLAAAGSGWRARLASRWIAAGAGCDCWLEPQVGSTGDRLGADETQGTALAE